MSSTMRTVPLLQAPDISAAVHVGNVLTYSSTGRMEAQMRWFARPISLGLLITVAMATSVSAQYSGRYRGGGGTHWRSASLATSNLLLNRAIQRQGTRLRQGLVRNRTAAPAARPAGRGKASQAPQTVVRRSAASAAGSATRFTPVAPSIVPQELALASGRDAAGQGEMRRFFEECLVNYEKSRRERGWPFAPKSARHWWRMATSAGYPMLKSKGSTKRWQSWANLSPLARAWPIPAAARN